MCFGITKLWCLWLNIIGYFFSLFYMPMHDMLKKKEKKYICEEYKSKKNQNAFKYGWKHVSRRCESYMMYFEGDSPHQAIMIVCKLNWFSHISNRHNIRHLCTLAMFSHTTRKFFATFDTCAGTMWIGHHKGYMCYYMLTKLS